MIFPAGTRPTHYLLPKIANANADAHRIGITQMGGDWDAHCKNMWCTPSVTPLLLSVLVAPVLRKWYCVVFEILVCPKICFWSPFPGGAAAPQTPRFSLEIKGGLGGKGPQERGISEKFPGGRSPSSSASSKRCR